MAIEEGDEVVYDGREYAVAKIYFASVLLRDGKKLLLMEKNLLKKDVSGLCWMKGRRF